MRHGWRALGWLVTGGMAGCAAPRHPAVRSGTADSAASTAAPVVTEPSVVAFWLALADTVPETDRATAREDFRRSNAQVGHYLSDTDIALVATVNDTVIVSLSGGTRRTLTLVGLDYPYGYVFIDPGYAEEYHTGIPEQDELEAAIDDYFGLEDPDPPPRRRIAAAPHGGAILLDIHSRGREGSALRFRTLDARVFPAAAGRRGCARCAWLRGPAGRRSHPSTRTLSRPR